MELKKGYPASGLLFGFGATKKQATGVNSGSPLLGGVAFQTPHLCFTLLYGLWF